MIRNINTNLLAVYESYQKQTGCHFLDTQDQSWLVYVTRQSNKNNVAHEGPQDPKESIQRIQVSPFLLVSELGHHHFKGVDGARLKCNYTHYPAAQAFQTGHEMLRSV